MLKAFPKIFAIGQDYIADLFKDDVEITEKIDGSQMVFGRVDGELYLRSKGAQLFPEHPDKMFKAGLDYVCSIRDKLPDNKVFYCEYLQKPRHNILQYDRVPTNNLMLFGVTDALGNPLKNHVEIEEWAQELGVEVVPLLYEGRVETIDALKELLDTESVLGKIHIEGIVVKNYQRPFLLGGQPIPIMMGKFVSEQFKEVHSKDWKKEYTGKGKWQTFKEGFCTEARWHKAVQHLKERGEIENAPRDIGKLFKEVAEDIIAEEKGNIEKFLWKEFGQEVIRSAQHGLAEWYKAQLLERVEC